MSKDDPVVVVTGGEGLVGKAIQHELDSFPSTKNQQWIFLSSKDGDLKDIQATRKLFDQYKPTYVIHLAASVGGLFKNMSSQLQMLEDNMLINQNILKMAHEFKVKKLISCLSTCIFPNRVESGLLLNETMIHQGPPHESNYGYAYAKRMLDVFQKAYNEQFGHCFTSIIPTNIYGPYDNFSLSDGHVIPSLIHQCYIASKQNTPFVVKGSGNPQRQFIYSHDLGKLIIWILENYNETESLILCPDEHEEISIASVSKSIAKAFDYKGPIIFDRQFADGQYKKTSSNKKLRGLLPDFQFTQIDQGMQETVDYFIKTYPNVRK